MDFETFEYIRHSFNFNIQVYKGEKTLVKVLLNNVELYFEEGIDKGDIIIKAIGFCKRYAAENSIYRAIELRD
jgi:hypothetical protein